MGVDGEPQQPTVSAGFVVTHDAFDRRASLALVEHHRLVVDDPMLIQHVRIDASGVRASAGISARVEQMWGRVQAHGVAGGELAGAP